jgi:hypothetical protein
MLSVRYTHVRVCVFVNMYSYKYSPRCVRVCSCTMFIQSPAINRTETTCLSCCQLRVQYNVCPRPVGMELSGLGLSCNLWTGSRFFSVSDPGYLSRILIFTHPGSRIQKQQQKRGEKKFVFIPFLWA